MDLAVVLVREEIPEVVLPAEAQAQARGPMGMVWLARPNPMPNRSGTSRTRSRPFDCSSKIAASPGSVSSRVRSIGERMVEADFNPRAAGQELHATVTVVAVRAATAEEERRGRV